jgi:hypothetical protein
MLGGRMVWVGMSRGRFVGGRNVKAPAFHMKFMNKSTSNPWRTEECNNFLYKDLFSASVQDFLNQTLGHPF